MSEKSTFIKGSDVGYDLDEIKATSTQELKNIRASIYTYLLSTNQKKRNANFKELFLRINEELKARQHSISNVIYKEAMLSLGVSKETSFISQKRFRDNLAVAIPPFLNDYTKEKIKKEEEEKVDKENIDIAIQKVYSNISKHKCFDFTEEDVYSYKVKKENTLDKFANMFEIKQHVLDDSLEEPLFTLDSDDE